ncbi:PREDICTED: uncharacterized protein LOC109165417 [Ipomoea nil]|uniref:uncharacterized protein LOC109165417 n=1 Tax=Ipomoea nil TaxID=35883 RepID=UPI000900E278|nr:PREDICTED: uncharacterized protein LOC109165417 [Ipomoea nil]XP_019169706.1 PREDICTED: uncharacterized protein LOC109165417 [Ipomoea nil]
MPSSESPIPFVSFRRPVLTLRGDQVHALVLDQGSSSQDSQIESFQSQVFTRFNDLSVANGKEFLSVSWVRKLLEAFASCVEDFRVIMCNKNALLSKQPGERILAEYFDRTIKALDICNATRDGLEKIRLWQRHLEIVVCALNPPQQRAIGEGHLRRARKALMDLALGMLDEKDGGSVFSHRNRSFKRRTKDHLNSPSGHSRSLSWSVSHSWSASKQLQLLANTLVPPRANEIAASNGLATLVFTMSFVLMFVLWALVAAIPCQDRGIQINIVVPRQCWSRPFHILQARIMDESKKRERRNSSGLLKEIYQIEEGVNHLTDMVDSVQLPLSEESKEELRGRILELSSICEVFKTELEPLERNLREVFRKIVTCRVEGLEFLGKATQA